MGVLKIDDTELNTNRIEGAEDLSLDELITLYKATLKKLEECARYSPSDDEARNAQVLDEEDSQFAFQDKLISHILKKTFTTNSNVKKTVKFWKTHILDTLDVDKTSKTFDLISQSLAYLNKAS